MTLLSSGVGGELTHDLAYIDANPTTVTGWLREGLGSSWIVREVGWLSLDDAASDLSPSVPLSRYAVVPVGLWTLILNNGPLGTDVGLLPSQAARELSCRAVRAVCVEDDEPGYAARILELYGPRGRGPLLLLRSIAAANDGGQWVFETAGEPLPFERLDRYTSRRKRDRFTCAMLYDYLRHLGVPIDVQPGWSRAVLVQMQQ